MTGLRALARLAVRDARRDRWRTVLVVLMVLLPVAGLVAVVAVLDTVTATAQERTVGTMGSADAVVTLGWSAATEDMVADAALADLRDRVQAGTQLEAITVTNDLLLDDGRGFHVGVTDQRLDEDSLSRGQVELLAGVPPTARNEVVVTSRLAESRGLEIGDRIELQELGSFDVTGVARRAEALSSRELFVTHQVVAHLPVAHVLLAASGDDLEPLVRGGDVVTDDVWPPGDLENPAWFVATREAALSQRYTSGERFAFVVTGGLAGVEVALIAGAAFAVSVRRRQRELGLLAAIGGSQRHVRRVVLLTGVVAALTGAVLGTALGIGALFAAAPWIDGLADRVTGGPSFDVLWILTCAAIGIVAVIIGSWLPARGVARLPVTVALSGRRPTPVPSQRGMAAGVALVAAGVAVLFIAVAARGPYVFLLGCVLVVLGAGWTSPWLLERLATLAPRLPVGMRLAVRDAARYRTRNGPIVTAAMAGLAASITLASLLGSMAADAQAQQERSMSDQHLLVQGEPGRSADVARALASSLDAEHLSLERAPVEAHVPDVDSYHNAMWGTVELARELGGGTAADALGAGRAVVIGGPPDLTALSLQFYDESGEVFELPTMVPAVAVPGRGPDGAAWHMYADVLLPRDILSGPLPTDPDGWVSHLLVLDRPVTSEDLALATATAVDVGGDEVFVHGQFRDDRERLVRIGVITAGVVSGLAIVAVAIALAAAESRSDLRILGAVGANRRTRRALAVGRALLLSGLGGVLAVPVGLIPAYVVATRAGSDPLPSHIPWLTILIVAVGVPAVASLGAGVASRRDPGRLTRAA